LSSQWMLTVKQKNRIFAACAGLFAGKPAPTGVA